MRRMRSPSCIRAFCVRSVEATGCLTTCNSSENGPDRHAEPGEIALAQNIAGHDLTGCENIRRSPAIAHEDGGAFVHLHAQISKCNPRTQRVREERGCIELARPVRFVRTQAASAAAVEPGVIE